MPIDTIILYMESGHTPLAVELPRGVDGGEDGDDQLESDVDSVVVKEPHVAVVVVKKEFDWLNEGLEGADFDDDVFGVVSPPHSVPPKPNTVPPESNNEPPQPTTDTPQLTIDTPQPNTIVPSTNTDTPQSNTIPPPYIDVDEEWAEPALEDDIVSIDGSDDKQRPDYP